jgi:hypothetical protein
MNPVYINFNTLKRKKRKIRGWGGKDEEGIMILLQKCCDIFAKAL